MKVKNDMIPKQQALSPFQLPCSEYTNAYEYCVINYTLARLINTL